MSLIRATLALLAAGTLAAGGARAQTSLTIYNDGRVLMRRTVPVRVPSGVSVQRVPLGLLDPASIFSLDPAVTIVRSAYDGAVDEASVLRRAVGRRITFRIPRGRPDGTVLNDTLSAVVLSADPLQLQLADGRVTFAMPGQPLYPADLVVSVPAAALTLESAGARDNLRLGYFTQGASWNASYQVILGGAGAAGDARVTGTAVVRSEMLRADSAEVQLLAGTVNSAAPQYAPMAARAGRVAMQSNAMDEAAMKVSEQRVGEFHLYSVPERLTLLPGQTSSAAMFDPASVRYERNYVVHGQLPFWGYLPQQPNEEDVPVEVSYTLKRPRKTDFGDRPLPGGVARLFQADSAGRLQLVGEASTDHTPAGEDLRLTAGNAFDLTAKRVQTSYTTRRDSVAGIWRTTATADYRVTLSNATDSSATVDVQEERRGDWVVVSSSVKPEKVSSSITRFRVVVPARKDAVLTYRVRVTW